MSTESRRLRWLILAATFLAVAMLIVWWPGCRRHPKVTSPEALQILRQLYTACNTRDDSRLMAVEKRVETAIQAGQLSSDEQKSIRSIIARARRGDWSGAEKESFRFAQDQVR